MNALVFFRLDGSVAIQTKPNVIFEFITVSWAVNFCNDHNIVAHFPTN